ncbi:MAG: type II toxin-antitoxin system HipA family toxin [Flavobacterium sp.]
MKSVEKIKAYLLTEHTKQEIGQMVVVQNKIYFKYHEDFLETALEISPFRLKRTSEIVTPTENHFEGLFGVFHDSLPDGWGRLLLDRKLKSLQVDLNSLTALDRLSFLDNNSMGAIAYEPVYETNVFNSHQIDLDKIASEINMVLSGDASDVVDELFQLGGSSGGARPKILVGYKKNTNELLFGKDILPDGFEHWIIKFPSSHDREDIALIEYTYNQMAERAGIEVASYKLFKSAKGNIFFGSKRFDRRGNTKIHLHSAAGLLHDNFRMSTLDYGHLMDAAFKLEKDVKAYSKIFRMAAFNVLAHNRDDHSKNFSFLMDAKGVWSVAPAYDLTFSTSSFGMHSTAVFGELKSPGREHLLQLASHFKVKNPTLLIDEVQSAINQFEILAHQNMISKDSTQLIKSQLSRVNSHL